MLLVSQRPWPGAILTVLKWNLVKWSISVVAEYLFEELLWVSKLAFDNPHNGVPALRGCSKVDLFKKEHVSC